MANVVRIVMVDHNSGVSKTELAPAAKALELQVNRDFSLPPPLGYGISCSIRVATSSAPPVAGEWELGLFHDPDEPDALGYHDENNKGVPLMKIFPLLDIADGVAWTTTASHEILETLADPNLDKAAQAPNGVFYAYEVADACENDFYLVNGIKVSNFVLPPYFEPPSSLSGVKLDFMGLIKRPYELRPGGYNQYWTGSRWKIVEMAMRSARKSLKQHGRGGRRAALKSPYEYDASLVRVVDGDTVVLNLKRTFAFPVDFGFHIQDVVSLTKESEQKFRLSRINAPEIDTDAGKAAKVEFERLLQLGTLRVLSKGQDKYGRWLGEVYVKHADGSEIDVNQVMLDGGFAKLYP